MPADGLPVIITELALPFRVITFSGRDRPEQPVRRGTKQRAIQTWYPGAQKASTQVMGIEEDPLLLRGWFRDPLTILDGGATTRIAVLRGLLQGQNLCQLIWGDIIVAQGRVAECQFDYERTQIVRYEVRFDIDQGNEAVALIPLPIVAAAARDLKEGLDQAFVVADNSLDVVRGGRAIDAIV